MGWLRCDFTLLSKFQELASQCGGCSLSWALDPRSGQTLVHSFTTSSDAGPDGSSHKHCQGMQWPGGEGALLGALGG